jgi:hypothetical protein
MQRLSPYLGISTEEEGKKDRVGLTVRSESEAMEPAMETSELL